MKILSYLFTPSSANYFYFIFDS